MDQIEKFIAKLQKKQAQKIGKALLDIVALQLENYDIEKMSGYKNHYRIRIGKIRVVFLKYPDRGVPIFMEYRGSAYKKF